MNITLPTTALLSLALTACAMPPSRDTAGGREAVPATAAPPAPAGALAYRPPEADAPPTRVGGDSRGFGGEAFELTVLAPDHTALTTQAQPTLYWFTSEPIDAPTELTLTAPGADEPLLERTLAPPLPAGIHRLSLADEAIELEPGIDYQWFVAMVADRERRSKDLVTGGEIRRVRPSDTLQQALASQPAAEERPRLYAESGYWYDALEGISELVAARPDDATLRDERAALLEQAGLASSAAYERQRL